MVAHELDGHFLWRVEEACTNAYPASREMLLEGWLLRAAGGHTRRINSVNALRGGPTDPSPVIDAATRIYAARGQPALFRAVSLVPEMDGSLAERGFASEGLTLTLMRDLAPDMNGFEGDVALVTEATNDWYEAWAMCRADVDLATTVAYRAALGSLLVPAAFACRYASGMPVAVAYAALHRGVAVLESLITHPAHRKRGYAREVVQALALWARQNGAEAFCLQGAADNMAARKLYASLGFDRELYRYHYRVAPLSG